MFATSKQTGVFVTTVCKNVNWQIAKPEEWPQGGGGGGGFSARVRQHVLHRLLRNSRDVAGTSRPLHNRPERVWSGSSSSGKRHPIRAPEPPRRRRKSRPVARESRYSPQAPCLPAIKGGGRRRKKRPGVVRGGGHARTASSSARPSA